MNHAIFWVRSTLYSYTPNLYILPLIWETKLTHTKQQAKLRFRNSRQEGFKLFPRQPLCRFPPVKWLVVTYKRSRPVTLKYLSIHVSWFYYNGHETFTSPYCTHNAKVRRRHIKRQLQLSKVRSCSALLRQDLGRRCLNKCTFPPHQTNIRVYYSSAVWLTQSSVTQCLTISVLSSISK